MTLALLGAGGISAFADVGALTEKFEKRRSAVIVPLRVQLSKDLRALEQRYAKSGDLDQATKFKGARTLVEKSLDGEPAKRGVPVIDETIGEDGRHRMKRLRDDYRRKIGKVLAPLLRVYATELAKLEKSLTAAGKYEAASKAKGERVHAERQSHLIREWPRVPEGAVEFGGNQYLFIDKTSTWHKARKKCADMGGHLVTVTNEKENRFVRNLSRKKNLWLGATDEEKEGEWVWITGEPFEYSHWNSRSPDNHKGNQHYAYYWSKGGWDDHSPDADQATAICEWDKPEYY